MVEQISIVLGRVLFPRCQKWEQSRNAKLWTGVAVFTAAACVFVVKFLK